MLRMRNPRSKVEIKVKAAVTEIRTANSLSGAVIRKSPIENTKNPIDIAVILQSGSK